MNSIVPNGSHGVDDRARSIVLTLRQLVESNVERSFIIEKAVAELAPLAALDSGADFERYSSWLSSLEPELRSSICRQLEVEGYLKEQTWFVEPGSEIRWPCAGDRVNQFHLLEEVGRGQCSRVFLCRQTGVGDRQVIVKFSHGAPLEADVLGRLRHENIVPIHFAAEESNGRSFICMPFLGRSTLADFIGLSEERHERPRARLIRAATMRRQPTDAASVEVPLEAPPLFYSSAECVAWLGWRLALALAHAHDQGIVHGDVKPTNVLLSQHGSPLLVDFNLSGSRYHSTEAKGGTLPYMPPEQLQGFAEKAADSAYDHRSDLFSLGALLYETLVARLPFAVEQGSASRKEYARELYLSQRQGPPPLRSIDKSVPQSVATAIERCLAFHPEQRLQSAWELARRLGAEFKWRRRAAKVLKHHWIATSLGGASVLAAASVATAMTLLRLPEHEVLFNKGVEAFAAGDFVTAANDFDRSLMLQPESVTCRFNLARSLLRANELAKAVDYFQALQEREKSARGAAYIAYGLSLQGKIDLAAAWHVKALQYSSVSPEVHNNIAALYEFAQKTGMGRSEQLLAAKKHVSIAKNALPDSITVRYNQLRIELALAETIGSIITAETASVADSLAESCPHEAIVQAICGRVFVQRSVMEKQRLDKAIECLNRAVDCGYRLYPESPEWRLLHSHREWPALLLKAEASSATSNPPSRISRFLEPTSLID